jgi:hypothetical protein
VESTEEWQTYAHEFSAPQLSIIEIDQDMEDNKALPEPQELAEAPKSALQPTATLEIEEEEEWQHDAITMTEENYILKHYAKTATPTSGITMDMYLGLRTGKVLSISLLLALTDVQLRQKWKGMQCRDLTVQTQPQGPHGQCSVTSLRNRAVLRSTEVMCIVHVTPMHYGMVIALQQSSRVDLIWCDSLQRDGRQDLYTYSQYYHFLETEMNIPQAFQPTRYYSSDLMIRAHYPKLPRQHNGTDCGIFTLLYQQTVSRWYGTVAGQEFTNDSIQDLLSSLGNIDQAAASEHRG